MAIFELSALLVNQIFQWPVALDGSSRKVEKFLNEFLPIDLQHVLCARNWFVGHFSVSEPHQEKVWPSDVAHSVGLTITAIDCGGKGTSQAGHAQLRLVEAK